VLLNSELEATTWMATVQDVSENRYRSYELHKYDCGMNIHRDKLLMLLVAYMQVLIRTHACYPLSPPPWCDGPSPFEGTVELRRPRV
jgi:hypothetical protein